MIFQFLIALLGTGFVVSTASLIWPRFTEQPRPPQLEKVREVVMQTPVGQQAATVLGVADSGSIEPINISSLAGTLTQQAGSAVTEKVAQEVTSRAVSQIISQIDKLPEDQRQILQSAICQPTPQQ